MAPSELKPAPRRLRDKLVAWEVLAIGLVVTLAVWMQASRHLAREAQARFDAETTRMTLSLRSEIDHPLLALDAFRGLFDAPRDVDPQAWKAFVSHFDVQNRFPGMRTMGFARAVHDRDLLEFKAYTRKVLGREVDPHPQHAKERPGVYLSVLFMEPELPRFREEILGLDLMFDGVRRDALMHAIRSGKLSITPPLTLQRGIPGTEEPHPGVVFYLPVFDRIGPADTPAARERGLRGAVFGSMHTDTMLAHAFEKRVDLQVRVDDAQADWKGLPLYESGKPGEARRGRSFERKDWFPVGQRNWVITYRSAPNFALGLREWVPTGILLGGLAISMVLFGFTRAQMQGRARAEAMAKALQESEDRFRSLADTAACVIILYSDVIEYVNDYACALLGYAREEILGRPFWTTVHPDDQGKIKARGEARLRGEAVPNRYEFRLVGKDGREHWIDFTAGRINWGGKSLGLATAFDITDRVKAVEERLQLERKLLEAQRLESLGLLAGGIAHDFNNLLGAILGHASLAEDALPPDSAALGSLERIRTTTQQAAELSRQMLAYSGRGTLVVEPLNLGQQVRTISSLIEASVPKKVRIGMDLAEGLPCIKADASQLHQVIMILVTNAAEAIQGQGQIQLRTGLMELDSGRLERAAAGRGLPPGDYVFLEVQDSGKGMDAATAARIFDPFFSTKFTGRGLGLAALQGIVQGHGGAIEVQSQPGTGSRFSVFFPACTEAAPAALETGPIEIPRLMAGKTRILLAEDEAALMEATAEVLQRAGYEVVAAADGGQAVDRFELDARGFALAILDLTMPVLDGRECFKKLRELRPDLKVILASGYGGPEAGAKFGEGELAGFLQKPHRSRELIAMVRKVRGEGE